jgi:hypothetical protein
MNWDIAIAPTRRKRFFCRSSIAMAAHTGTIALAQPKSKGLESAPRYAAAPMKGLTRMGCETHILRRGNDGRRITVVPAA